jgi:hypothetical protein
MLKKLPRFAVRLALIGLNEENAEGVRQDLEEELLARSHYENPCAFWDVETRRVIVEVNTEGLNPEQVANQSLEEMFEILPAILAESEGLRFEVLTVERL